MINETDIEAMTPEEPFSITIHESTKNEDGSVDISYSLDDAGTIEMARVGVEFVLHCAAAGMDMRDALDLILSQGEEADA